MICRQSKPGYSNSNTPHKHSEPIAKKQNVYCYGLSSNDTNLFQVSHGMICVITNSFLLIHNLTIHGVAHENTGITPIGNPLKDHFAMIASPTLSPSSTPYLIT